MSASISPAFLKIFVADLNRAAAFYTRCFGLVEARRIQAREMDEAVLSPIDDQPGVSLVLCCWSDGRTLDLGNAHGPIGFMVDDVDARFDALVAAGAAQVVAPISIHGARVAVIRDLDGHSIELIRLRGGS